MVGGVCEAGHFEACEHECCLAWGDGGVEDRGPDVGDAGEGFLGVAVVFGALSGDEGFGVVEGCFSGGCGDVVVV